MKKFVQKDQSNCFIGCVKYLQHRQFKKVMSEHQIKQIFNFTNNGVKLSEVIKNSIKAGFRTEAYIVEDKFCMKNYEYIILLHNKHYTILDNRKNVIFDPAIGTVKVSGDPKVGDVIIVVEFDEEFVINTDEIFSLSENKVLSLTLWNIVIAALMLMGTYYSKDLLENYEMNMNYKNIVISYGILFIFLIIFKSVKSYFSTKILMHESSNYIKKLNGIVLSFNYEIKNYFTIERIKELIVNGISYLNSVIIERSNIISGLAIFASAVTLLWFNNLVLLFASLVLMACISTIKIVFENIVSAQERIVLENTKNYNDVLNIYFHNLNRSLTSEKKKYYDVLNETGMKLIDKKLVSTINRFGILMNIFSTILSYVALPLVLVSKSLPISEIIFLLTLNGMLISNGMSVIDYFSKKSKRNMIKSRIEDVLIHSHHEKNHNEINKGHYQIIGKNGSGKTTLINTLTGLKTTPNTFVKIISSNTTLISKNLLSEMSDGERQYVNYLDLLDSNNPFIFIDEGFNSIPIQIRKKMYVEILKKFDTVYIVDHDINLKIKEIRL